MNVWKSIFRIFSSRAEPKLLQIDSTSTLDLSLGLVTEEIIRPEGTTMGNELCH